MVCRCHVVIGKPVIDELKSVMESRGMSATLLCRSHGHPAPTITFRRLTPPTDTIYRSGRLYVSNTRYKHRYELRFQHQKKWQNAQNCRVCADWMHAENAAGQFAGKPTRGQPSRALVNSPKIFCGKFRVYNRSQCNFGWIALFV